ncbi:hypothetical protein [Candidatus Bathycorpusculum sp.]|uniref:hypothetical protein n=1 Tax=Candidatus Bathycorpusculum sp. TaxID=2994959 RepID=UPI002839AE9C|nr:hypothetical protein [Candidatus Termitimicrobium sp.]MCL2686761.1 hypothetical protein [Candidatus Termitimicrobium sp.]
MNSTDFCYKRAPKIAILNITYTLLSTIGCKLFKYLYRIQKRACQLQPPLQTDPKEQPRVIVRDC